LYASIGTSASHVVTILLFQSFCDPIALYGLESVRLSNSNLYCLQYVINVCLFKILKTRNERIVDNCLYYLNMLPVSPRSRRRKPPPPAAKIQGTVSR